MSAQGSTRLVAGMVGGGDGADIGKTHRHAMRLDDQYDWRPVSSGRIPTPRHGWLRTSAYPPTAPTATTSRWPIVSRCGRTASMSSSSPRRTTATSRSPASSCAGGISVVCEKPLTQDSATAAELVEIAESSGAILAVPHCYSAYAMVRHAARMVRDGDLGADPIRRRRARLGMGGDPARTHRPQAGRWRTDPDIAGDDQRGRRSRHARVSPAALHHRPRRNPRLRRAEHPGARPAGIRQRRCSADLVQRRPATLWASMAATGNEHGLRIRVFGDLASLEWRHEDPHHLVVRDLDGGTTILAHGMSTLSEDAARLTRPGLGHPEGFLEHSRTSTATSPTNCGARATAHRTSCRDLSIPTGIDGLIGVQFVEAAAASHADDGAWVVPGFAADRRSVSDMQRFALIGAGFIGGVHAGNLAAHPDVDFAFVYDIDRHARKIACRPARLAASRRSRRRSSIRQQVDAVFIASSTDTHADHLRRAADADLPVLCEKPIDLDLAPRRRRRPVRERPRHSSPWSTSTAVSTATTPSSTGRGHRRGRHVQLIQMTSRAR